MPNTLVKDISAERPWCLLAGPVQARAQPPDRDGFLEALEGCYPGSRPSSSLGMGVVGRYGRLQVGRPAPVRAPAWSPYVTAHRIVLWAPVTAPLFHPARDGESRLREPRRPDTVGGYLRKAVMGFGYCYALVDERPVYRRRAREAGPPSRGELVRRQRGYRGAGRAG